MQNRNIFRWIAAVLIAVLISYLRVTGYLPESTQETVHEGQPAAESEQETVAENETSAENEQDENSALARDEFCRTTYEVFVYSFCDSNGDGIGDLPGLLSRLDYINDGNPERGEDLGMTGLWLMPVFPSNTYHKYDVTDFCRDRSVLRDTGGYGRAYRGLPREGDDSDPGSCG